jgi:hypothetical protein
LEAQIYDSEEAVIQDALRQQLRGHLKLRI